LTVLGEFEPQNVVGHRVDPKKALPYVTTRFEPSCMKFHARITSVGESGEKIKIKKRGLIFHVFRQALPYGRLAQILSCVRLVDIINCAKFYCNQLRDLDSVRGRSLTIPIGLQCRR